MDPKKRRQAKIARQQEIVNAAREAGREMTAEETAEFNTLQREIEALNVEIRDLEANHNNGGATPETRSQTNTGTSGNDAVLAERQRITDITDMCRSLSIEDAKLQRYIKDGTSVENVRSEIIGGMMEQGTPIATRGNAEVTNDEQDKFRRAAADALILRSGMKLTDVTDGARDLMGLSLRDLAIDCLSSEGEKGLNRRSADELYSMLSRQAYNPTAAFPAILDNAINKAYVEGHKTVAVTFDKWTTKGSLRDFKTHDNNYLAGPAGEFLEVPEGSELKADKMSDEKKPTRKLKTYGRQFTMTRQAFINDDIDFVTKIPAKYAKSARKTINKQCYQILVNNPAVYDGTALFSSTHGNLVTTGTGITQASMQAMIMALQNQKDEFGEAIIIRPAKIIVPSGMSFDIYTLFNSATINTSGNTQAVNPLFAYKDKIEVIEDPTINVLCGDWGNVMPWYIVGNSDDTDFIQVDYLDGKEIPTIRRMETPGQLGFVWDIYLDWGISVMDYRGAIKNPGIAVNNPL